MTKPHTPYLPPAAAKRAFRLEAQRDDPSLEGEVLDAEVRRRYKIYLTAWNNHFRRSTRLRHLVN